MVNTNDAPVFTSNPITGADATENRAYAGNIAGSATDVDAGDTLTYAKGSGPDWLLVSPDGTLTGTPAASNIGANVFTVTVTDGIDTATATLNITVVADNPDSNGNGIPDAWEIAKFGNANPGANPADGDLDGDGFSNLMEFALDTNPIAANKSPLLSDFHIIDGGQHLRLTVPKNPAASNLEFIVETGSSLNDWSTTSTVIESETSTELIVRDTFTTATALRRYIRLQVRVKP